MCTTPACGRRDRAGGLPGEPGEPRRPEPCRRASDVPRPADPDRGRRHRRPRARAGAGAHRPQLDRARAARRLCDGGCRHSARTERRARAAAPRVARGAAAAGGRARGHPRARRPQRRAPWPALPLGAWIAARHGAPYWVAHRGDLHGALSAAAAAEPRITLRPGFALASLTQTDVGVQVSSAGGEAIAGRALVGADGLWSSVRQAVCPSMLPQFVGATATRTVIPAAEAGRLAAPVVGLWLTPGVHVVHYPVRAGADIAVVVIAREDWQGRTGRPRQTRLPCSRSLGDFHASLTEVLARVPQWRKWALYRLPPLPRWSAGLRHADGRCRAPDAALSGARRRAGARGCARAERLPRRPCRRRRERLPRLRSQAPPPRPARAGDEPAPGPHLSPRAPALPGARRRPAPGARRLADGRATTGSTVGGATVHFESATIVRRRPSSEFGICADKARVARAHCFSPISSSACVFASSASASASGTNSKT